VALNEYRLGKLDRFIESNTINEPIKVKKVKTKNKVQLKHSVKSVENIYQSTRWADTKKVVYSLYDFKCMKCGAKDKEMHVDHICPVSKYPAMKWSINNLQLLCKGCNMEKSNVNENDYRTLEQKDLCSKYMNGEI
jgi:5-methylcytosine-specific restriction endonuclease McrA